MAQSGRKIALVKLGVIYMCARLLIFANITCQKYIHSAIGGPCYTVFTIIDDL